MGSLVSSISHPIHTPALRIASLALVTTFYLAPPAFASSSAEAIPSPEALAQLEQRASLAKPREQCFLYTEIVHAMTEKAGKEIADGDTDAATATLKQINQYAHLIHLDLSHNTKRVKNAQMLMHNATYRLGQYLHLVSGDDQQTVKDTLKQLNQINEELLTQVFDH